MRFPPAGMQASAYGIHKSAKASVLACAAAIPVEQTISLFIPYLHKTKERVLCEIVWFNRDKQASPPAREWETFSVVPAFAGLTGSLNRKSLYKNFKIHHSLPDRQASLFGIRYLNDIAVWVIFVLLLRFRPPLFPILSKEGNCTFILSFCTLPKASLSGDAESRNLQRSPPSRGWQIFFVIPHFAKGIPFGRCGIPWPSEILTPAFDCLP